MTVWQDSWTFRIVDQDTGAAVPGVPVSVLESGGGAGGYWVSDGDGLVRIPKHDQPRLRLRVGLRDRKSTRLNSSHSQISYAVFCLKKKKNTQGTSYEGRRVVS